MRGNARSDLSRSLLLEGLTLRDELRVIRNDGDVWDNVSTVHKEVGCGEAQRVQGIIRRGCIAHGEHGCGHHGIREWIGDVFGLFCGSETDSMIVRDSGVKRGNNGDSRIAVVCLPVSNVRTFHITAK